MYKVILKSCGNPDYRQYAPISRKKTVKVKTLREAAAACVKYIDENDLGSGNWDGGQILDATGKQFARVTYNGRVRDMNDDLINLLD